MSKEQKIEQLVYSEVCTASLLDSVLRDTTSVTMSTRLESSILTVRTVLSSLTWQNFAFVGAGVALVTHRYCRSHEPSIFGFLALACGLELVSVFTSTLSLHGDVTSILQKVAAFNASFWIILAVSISTYRLFLNPLCKFPGPWSTRLSKLPALLHASRGDTHKWLQSLHHQYGDIVRVAPNELSFSHPDAVGPLHGPASNKKIAKGPWYDGIPNQKGTGLASTRSLSEHKARRQIWDRGFGPKALASYEPRVLGHLQTLTTQLTQRSGQVVNFSDWCDFFAFDVMGDLAFGEDFDMLEKAIPHEYMPVMHGNLRLVSIFSHIPWAKQILPFLPMDAKSKYEAERFQQISGEKFTQRKARGTERDDIFSYLLESDTLEKPLSDPDLIADASAVIVGGSDTTTVCLTMLFYLLARHPQAYATLQKEIDELWDGISPLTSRNLNSAKQLTGVINESLRLFPPGPNGMQRTIPQSGYTVQDNYIPEDTQVSVHGYSIQNDERNFSHASEFLPERWIEEQRPEKFNHDTRAFIPFSAGQYGCVGKALAMQEMRLFVATMAKNFDVAFAPQHDDQAFLDSIESNLSLLKGDLWLQVTRRTK
jgi:cytochrome P450 family 628